MTSITYFRKLIPFIPFIPLWREGVYLRGGVPRLTENNWNLSKNGINGNNALKEVDHGKNKTSLQEKQG